MKKISFTLTLVLLGAGLFSSPVYAAQNWELVKDKDDIKVYTRPFEGSDVDEFKGTTVINAGIEAILALFMDIEGQSTWMDQCIEAKLVKRVNAYEGIIYNVTDLPWPCDDRDVVVRQYFKVDNNGRILIDFHAIENDTSHVPLREDTVRMTELKGQWLLVSLDRRRTQLTYKIRANPAGMIPTWMANYASRSIPYKTLTSVAEKVKDPKYAELGKKLQEQHRAIAEEMVKGRLRANAKEIREKGGNDTLLELLQKDEKLIEAILNVEGEARPLILKWVDTNYHQVDGKWQKKAEIE